MNEEIQDTVKTCICVGHTTLERPQGGPKETSKNFEYLAKLLGFPKVND